MNRHRIEGGFTPIDNKLLEVILCSDFQYYELKIVLAIARLTYGWNRKHAPISYGALSKLIGYDRSHIIRSCNRLKKDRVILIEPGTGRFQTNIISINKNFDEWRREKTVDNFEDPVPVEAPGMVPLEALVRATSDALGGTTPSARRGTPLNKPEERFLKKPEESKNRPVEQKGKTKQKNLSELLKGWETQILDPDPRRLVEYLSENGYPFDQVWAAVVQTRERRPNNPAAYFVKIMADPNHGLSDSAWEKSKIERRKYGF